MPNKISFYIQLTKIHYVRTLVAIILQPIFAFPQTDSDFYKVPFTNNDIIYESVVHLDSVYDKNKVFNAAKSTLIRNTNYKYSKVDEDRNSGNITAEITFDFVAKPTFLKSTFNAYSRLSIDVKEDRFRIRLYGNGASIGSSESTIDLSMPIIYLEEKKQIKEGEWKEKRSLIIPWHRQLDIILQAFGMLIKDGLNDDDF